MGFQQIKMKIQAFGRRVQARVVHYALLLLYVFGIGAARLWAALFHRKLLQPPTENQDSLWLEVKMPEFNEIESLKQS